MGVRGVRGEVCVCEGGGVRGEVFGEYSVSQVTDVLVSKYNICHCSA